MAGSFFGVLFLFGALLFLIVMMIAGLSMKGRGALTGRPLLTAVIFAFAIALMAGPAMSLILNKDYAPQHAFRMYFGKQAADTVTITHNASRGGADISTVLLVADFSTAAEFEAYAIAAKLVRTNDVEAPTPPARETPDWWTPQECDGALSVWRAAPSSNWRTKWATFCDAGNRAFIYASWIAGD